MMYQAAQAEDETSHQVSEKMARLEYENGHLREVLQLSYPVVSSQEDGIDLHSSEDTVQQESREKKSSSQWSYNDRF